ncbi:glutamate-5-semialdehyde dehydrogenase [Campylobacter sp. TTU_617]|uniref:glutamate-5-semialdehyde dehydrogenase n=1 Tax=Campylobacter sp. TTU_617 TaxID=2768148 RepID=UPI001905CDA5|nr:glutamate-5-semialdehyde dehydrogenase [Campylobacter sp. TTU_617]MBK1972007.1 glutamate-5-semialdehyde dehydrogenase [Campylobacter sp. TTU_617]
MRNFIQNIKKNSQKLYDLNPQLKENIILEFAQILKENSDFILEENLKDLHDFKKDDALKDRLLLNKNRLKDLCLSLEQIAYLQDPIGSIIEGWVNEDGLLIQKIRIPIGLICVIYEARPALSAEIIALMLKSSNACILKGGGEAKNTNTAIFTLINKVLSKYHLNDCFSMFFNKDDVYSILKMDDLIDVIIPRGSSKMIQELSKNTKIPLIKQDKGLCHIFVDYNANLEEALKIVINAKCQRVSVCNALETLLVHKSIAKDFFNLLIPKLKEFKVKIHTHKNALSFFENSNLEFALASDETFYTEWLSYELSIKIVNDCQEAIEHINKYSSSHSEAILSNDFNNIEKFKKTIQSACVYINASTRFSDGSKFGFGGEVGISTNKLHARGPMGINEICTYKYIINGQGQIRN